MGANEVELSNDLMTVTTAPKSKRYTFDKVFDDVSDMSVSGNSQLHYPIAGSTVVPFAAPFCI